VSAPATPETGASRDDGRRAARGPHDARPRGPHPSGPAPRDPGAGQDGGGPHLVFLPGTGSAEPALFLWGEREAARGPGVVEELARAGRPGRAAVVAADGGMATVTGPRIPLRLAVPLLARVQAAELARLPASVAAWSLAAKLALELIARERVVPRTEPAGGGTRVTWGVALALPEDAERVARLAAAFPPDAHAIPRADDTSRSGDGDAEPEAASDRGPIWPAPALLTAMLDATADVLVRDAAAPDAPDRRTGPAAAVDALARRSAARPAGLGDTETATTARRVASGSAAPGGPHDGRRARRPSRTGARGPAIPAGARWEARWLAALTAPVAPARALGADFLDRALARELAEWATAARGRAAERRPRLCLKLDPPEADGRGAWTLGYFLEAADDPSLVLPADDVWRAGRRHPLAARFAAAQETLLQALGEAARLFPPIERTLDAPRPVAAVLTEAEVWQLLSEGAALLTAAGFTVRLPVALTPSGQRRLRLRLHAGGPEGAAESGTGAVKRDDGLSLDALLAYRWEIALGDRTLAPDEFRALAELKRPLVRWRGEWVVVDPGEIAGIRRLMSGDRGGLVAARDVLAAALGGARLREDAPVPVEVVPGGPLAAALERLRREPPSMAPPPTLAGTLRPYQARGLAWLALLADLGLGGCLADDMGLGKTVQAIAFLLARRAARPADPRPALIVCPTSVVGNWERELARFAPSLPVVRHHGPDRATEAAALLPVPGAVVVTTYPLLRRDRALLTGIDWGAAVLDEAQNVKNPGAQQAAAARALRAAPRFALTGTPVENRLAELWSILDFCVPGLLGPLAAFRRRFAVPVERYRDEGAAAALRRLTGPFVLRRVKSDPAIVADLPPKQEIAVACTLTREQATLYQAALAEAMAQVRAADGIARRGRILALLTALKQICNHPAHYLGQPGPLPGRSGKLDRVVEMLEESVAAGDRTLVFTQFREMGTRLVAAVERALGVEVLFLHGGVPRAARDAMVQRFQEARDAPPVFVLSLRAGGTGLNLTAATRVIHFDRWWNPAVEDQATDRAHRIGQRRTVQVYRLLTAGTVEERIDRLLLDKRALADRVIGAGEAWITELGDAELQELLALSTDAVVDADEGEPEPPPAGARGTRAPGTRRRALAALEARPPGRRTPGTGRAHRR